ncbi:MAG: hypothetical protein NZ922_02490 [Candidatus Methanomethyliaceae archaeon]|nr:hypothetical protein [Candidatus Methanomethyliaceae archaeon]MDW7971556.1 hypothetical protein [Nitrososphaerota archaeon]
MDKPIEMVMAFTIFLLAFFFVYTIGLGLYTAGINAKISSILTSMAEATASTIILQNGASSSLWQLWNPEIIPTINIIHPSYLIIKPKISLKATCFGDEGEILWIKGSEAKTEVKTPIGSAFRFLILDNGNAVKLEVYIIG